MSRLINFAKDYALEHHGDQEHGCLKIGEHLADVANHVSRHVRLNHVENVWHDIAVASAWLHDVIEDTEVTENKLSMLLGSLAMLGGMLPMLVGLLVRLRLVSSQIRLADGHGGFAFVQSTILQECRRYQKVISN